VAGRRGLLAERGCGVLTAAKLIGEIAGIRRFATDVVVRCHERLTKWAWERRTDVETGSTSVKKHATGGIPVTC
jgi:hypothetical protein